MEKIRFSCPSCSRTQIKMVNPEIPQNKLRCVGCGETIIVEFESDEVQMWDEAERMERETVENSEPEEKIE